MEQVLKFGEVTFGLLGNVGYLQPKIITLEPGSSKVNRRHNMLGFDLGAASQVFRASYHLFMGFSYN
jgi:hypothetical protein